ncbi:MAG TPA: cupin domain-containing protein [Candidatus Binatia bacterium]|jgi:mannose-6-phosphate isomerase-like protein (cupin superfamily)
MKITTITKTLRHVKKINDEIAYASLAEGRGFTSGIIVFRPRSSADAKQIRHSDKDVICEVLRGSGRLRVERRRIALKTGMLCHIPKGTPHDFAASKRNRLVLFYSLIETG